MSAETHPHELVPDGHHFVVENQGLTLITLLNYRRPLPDIRAGQFL
jgi:hypothetical protein